MAILSRDELLARLKRYLAEEPTQDDITLLEDIDDTYRDFEERRKADGTDWQAEYEKLDREWRDKYRARFFETKEIEVDEEDVKDEPERKYTYEELFEERKDD